MLRGEGVEGREQQKTTSRDLYIFHVCERTDSDVIGQLLQP